MNVPQSDDLLLPLLALALPFPLSSLPCPISLLISLSIPRFPSLHLTYPPLSSAGLRFSKFPISAGHDTFSCFSCISPIVPPSGIP